MKGREPDGETVQQCDRGASVGCPVGTTDAPEHLSKGTLKHHLQLKVQGKFILLDLLLGRELQMVL